MQRATISGAAAEAYVHYRLRSWGIDAHFAGGINSPFDLWAEIESEILKIQVKSCSKIRGNKQYVFGTAKGYSGFYAPGDWDIMALVALPEQAVWFTIRKDVKVRRLPSHNFTEEQEKRSWSRALKMLGEIKNE